MGDDADALISISQITRLNTMGFSFDQKLQDWEYMYKLTTDYVKIHGSLPDRNYRTDDNILLGAWLWRQMGRFAFLSENQQKKLSRIGNK